MLGRCFSITDPTGNGEEGGGACSEQGVWGRVIEFDCELEFHLCQSINFRDFWYRSKYFVSEFRILCSHKYRAIRDICWPRWLK